MRSKPRKYAIQGSFLALMLALPLSLGSLGAVNAQTDGDQQQPERNIAISSADDGVQVAATRPWTAEEMMNAEEFPMSVLTNEEDLASIQNGDEPKPTGPAGEVPGALPESDEGEEEIASAVATSDDASAATSNNASAAAVEGIQVPAASYSTYPYSTVGKLFFTMNGQPAGCSAVVIKNRAIWTAGHCVHEGQNGPDGWATNVVFVPQYHNGKAPLGQWKVSQLWTTDGWYHNQNYFLDYAGGLVDDLNGRAIGSRTGTLGFKYNQPRGSGTFRSIGYPSNPPFDDVKMIYCHNAYKTTLPEDGTSDPPPFSIDCNMAFGASGGPFIRDFHLGWTSGTNFLNGNNSRVSPNRYPNETFSPYFDGAAKRFYDRLPS